MGCPTQMNSLTLFSRLVFISFSLRSVLQVWGNPPSSRISNLGYCHGCVVPITLCVGSQTRFCPPHYDTALGSALFLSYIPSTGTRKIRKHIHVYTYTNITHHLHRYRRLITTLKESCLPGPCSLLSSSIRSSSLQRIDYISAYCRFNKEALSHSAKANALPLTITQKKQPSIAGCLRTFGYSSLDQSR